MACVWVASLERFGYSLLVVEKTRQKALDAMSAEYKKTYLKWNNLERLEDDEEFEELYKTAMDEIYIRKLEYGEVEWW